MLNPSFRAESHLRLRSIRNAAKVTFRQNVEQLSGAEKNELFTVLNNFERSVKAKEAVMDVFAQNNKAHQKQLE